MVKNFHPPVFEGIPGGKKTTLSTLVIFWD